MKKLLLFSLMFMSIFIKAQETQKLWTVLDTDTQGKENHYQLDISFLKNQLSNVKVDRFHIDNSSVTISFPNINGAFVKFKIAEASVMAPELQAKYPNSRSYIGKSEKNSIIRFSFSTYIGFDALIFDKNGITEIRKKENYYVVMLQKDDPEMNHSVECGVIDHSNNNRTPDNIQSVQLDGNFRTYRLALATTGELSQRLTNSQNFNTDADKKAFIMGFLNNRMTQVNAVFEQELSITLQLVVNNDAIIFLDPATDPYSNGMSTSSTCNENGAVCVNYIGGSNYDIGHVLYPGFVGLAGIGSVCGNQFEKARACSSEEIRTILHEMGHQFGAYHTFNNYGNYYNGPPHSVEIGSGSTIMSYGSGPLLYHINSINEMKSNILNHTCPTITLSGNTIPTVNAGTDKTIPALTPFVLEGAATDPDNTNLTFSWEQVDAGTGADEFPWNLNGPMFAWIEPINNKKRYFPKLEFVLDGLLQSYYPFPKEAIPIYSRDFNFIFAARDNDVRGGEIGTDNLTLNVDENSGPFKVTSDKSDATWFVGELKTLTWNVSGTDSGAVNTPMVDIYFSTDGGQTFPILLVENVPNIGHYDLVVPSSIITNQGRYMIKGHDNVFFNVNMGNLNVQDTEFVINIPYSEKNKDICVSSSNNTISFNFDYHNFNGFNGVVQLSASGLTGANINFSPFSVQSNNTNITMTIDNITSSLLGQNEIEITATSGNIIQTYKVYLHVFNDNFSNLNLISPPNGTILSDPYHFEWQASDNADSYNIQIADNNNFNNIIIDTIVNDNTFITPDLNHNTTYYWRVKPINNCSLGNFSQIYSFTTQGIGTYVPDDAFEQKLIDLGYDTGTLDDYVPTQNISSVTELDITNSGISDLTGIEDFKFLNVLLAYNNNISDIDISSNLGLKAILVNHNNLSSLDISHNMFLTHIYAGHNNLTSLDLENNGLLIQLEVNNNNIDSLDLTRQALLERFNANSNILRYLDFRNGNNTIISSASTQQTYFKCSSNYYLTCIYVDDAAWSTSNWAGGIDYYSTFVENETQCDAQYTAIPDSNFEQALMDLNLDPYPVIDHKAPTILLESRQSLYVANRNINDLTGIEAFTSLQVLRCENNNLISLDLTHNTNLGSFGCSNNNLNFLDLRNGNNTNMQFFYGATNNPDLTCIFVDDAAWSTSHWSNHIDPHSHFVETQAQCDALNINETTIPGFKLYPNPTDNILHISADETIKRISITNNLGQKIYESEANVKQLQISLASFAKGTYFVKVDSAHGRVVKVVFKK